MPIWGAGRINLGLAHTSGNLIAKSPKTSHVRYQLFFDFPQFFSSALKSPRPRMYLAGIAHGEARIGLDSPQEFSTHVIIGLTANVVS
jgi:hypothetical protein